MSTSINGSGDILTLSAASFAASPIGSSSGASLVGYLPAGAGAVATTVQETLKKRFIIADDFISTSNAAGANVTGWANLVTYVNTLPNGAHIQASRGVYNFNGPIAAPKNCMIVGEGRVSTSFLFSNAGDGIQSTWPINSSTAVNIAIRDINIECTNGANTGGGFADVGGTFLELTNVRMKGWKYNTILDQSELVRIDNCDFESWITAGLWIVNGAEHTVGANGGYTNQINITRCQFNTSVGAGFGYAIADDGGANHYIVGNNFNGGNYQIWAAGVGGLTILNNEFEAGTNAGGPIQLSATKSGGGATTPVTGFGIYENTCQWGSYNIYLWACHDGEIKKNNFLQYTTAAIDYDFTVTGRVSGVAISNNTKVLVGGGKTYFPFFAASRYQFFQTQGKVDQLEQYYVVSALAATGSQVITLLGIDGIAPGAVLLCTNADGTASEQVRVTAVSGLTFTATFASTKTANWTVRVLSQGWLPTMRGASTDTPGSWAYTTQQASFQQIGNRVYFDASVVWTAAGGTGQLQMSLPVVAKNVSGKFAVFTTVLLGAVGTLTGYPSCSPALGSAFAGFTANNPATGAGTSITSYATGSAYISGSYEV